MTGVAVAFRIDAGTGIGLGHLMRCTGLGVAMRQLTAEIELFIQGDGPMEQALSQSGLGWRRTTGDSEYRDLLKWQSDHHTASSILVVDRPGLSSDYIEQLRATTHPTMMVAFADDEPVCGPVDVVVNGNAYATRESSICAVSRADTLVGPRYLCLRPSLTESGRMSHTVDHNLETVLVTFGGSDPRRATPTVVACVLEAAKRRCHPLRIDVVVGPSFELDLPDGVDSSGRVHVRIHRGVFDLTALMQAADVAITAGGTTVNELAYLGKPVIAIPQTSAEVRNVAAMQAHGALVALPERREEWQPVLADTLVDLLRNRSGRLQMAEVGRRLIDGMGASRVTEVLNEKLRTACASEPLVGCG